MKQHNLGIDGGVLRRDLIGWYLECRRDLPWRRTRDAYGIWLSEVMLQQTRVEAVLGYWERFLGALPTVEDLAGADEQQVIALWSGLGYYRRARSLHAAAQLIVEQHGGVLPRDAESLGALPGFGPYTTGAVRSIAFGASAALVDGNVARVLSRLFALELEPGSGAANRKLWALANGLVPAALSRAARAKDPRLERASDLVGLGDKREARATGEMASDRGPGTWNQALMELGATVCAPTRVTKKTTSGPKCELCPVARHCGALAAGRTHELPLVKRAAPPIDVALEVLVLETDAGLLMRQRPADGRLASMWEFPTREVGTAPGATFLWPEAFDGGVVETEMEVFWHAASPLPGQRHSITCHRIRASIRYLRTNGTAPPAATNYDYVPRSRLESLPLTGLSAKILASQSADQ